MKSTRRGVVGVPQTFPAMPNDLTALEEVGEADTTANTPHIMITSILFALPAAKTKRFLVKMLYGA